MLRSENELIKPSFSRLRNGCPTGRISKKHSARRKELLRFVNNLEYNSYKSVSIAEKLKREINGIASYNEQTPEYVDEIREKLFLLHEYNTNVAKIAYTYPTSKETYELLGRYVALESDVLYKHKYDFKYERQVENRVFHTIVTFLKNSFSSEDNCLSEERKNVYNEALKIFISYVDVKYTSDEEKFPARIVKNILDTLGLIKKSSAGSSGHLDLNNPSLIRLKESLKDSDYGSDDDCQETASTSSESSFRTMLTRRNNEVKKESNDAINTSETTRLSHEEPSVSQVTLQSTSKALETEPIVLENETTKSSPSSLPDSRGAEQHSSGLKSQCNSSNSQPVPNFPSSNEVFSSISKDDVVTFVDLNVDEDIEVIRWSQRKTQFPPPQLERQNFSSSTSNDIPSDVKPKSAADKRNIEYRIYDTISIVSSEDEEEDFDYSHTNFDDIERQLREQKRKHTLLSSLNDTPHQIISDNTKKTNTKEINKSKSTTSASSSICSKQIISPKQGITNKSSDQNIARRLDSVKSKKTSTCVKRPENNIEKLSPEIIIDLGSSDEDEPVKRNPISSKNHEDTLIIQEVKTDIVPPLQISKSSVSAKLEATDEIIEICGEDEVRKDKPSSKMGKIFCRSIDQLTNDKNLVVEPSEQCLLNISRESCESVVELEEQVKTSSQVVEPPSVDLCVEERLIPNISTENGKESNCLNSVMSISSADSDVEIIEEECYNIKQVQSANEIVNSSLTNLKVDSNPIESLGKELPTFQGPLFPEKEAVHNDTKQQICSDATISESTSTSIHSNCEVPIVDRVTNSDTEENLINTPEKSSDKDTNEPDATGQSSSDAIIAESKATSNLNSEVLTMERVDNVDTIEYLTNTLKKSSVESIVAKTLLKENLTEKVSHIERSKESSNSGKDAIIEIIDCDEYESSIDISDSSLKSITVKTEILVDESDMWKDGSDTSNRDPKMSSPGQETEGTGNQLEIIPSSTTFHSDGGCINNTETTLENKHESSLFTDEVTTKYDEPVTEMLKSKEVDDVNKNIENLEVSTLSSVSTSLDAGPDDKVIPEHDHAALSGGMENTIENEPVTEMLKSKEVDDVNKNIENLEVSTLSSVSTSLDAGPDDKVIPEHDHAALSGGMENTIENEPVTEMLKNKEVDDVNKNIENLEVSTLSSVSTSLDAGPDDKVIPENDHAALSGGMENTIENEPLTELLKSKEVDDVNKNIENLEVSTLSSVSTSLDAGPDDKVIPEHDHAALSGGMENTIENEPVTEMLKSKEVDDVNKNIENLEVSTLSSVSTSLDAGPDDKVIPENDHAALSGGMENTIENEPLTEMLKSKEVDDVNKNIENLEVSTLSSVSTSLDAGPDDKVIPEHDHAALSGGMENTIENEPATEMLKSKEVDDVNKNIENLEVSSLSSVSTSLDAAPDDKVILEHDHAALSGGMENTYENEEQVIDGCEKSTPTKSVTYENKEKYIVESGDSDQVSLETEIVTESSSKGIVDPAKEDELLEIVENYKDKNCDESESQTSSSSLPTENKGENTRSESFSLDEEGAKPSSPNEETEIKEGQNTKDIEVVFPQKEHTTSAVEVTFDNKDVEALENKEPEPSTTTTTYSNEQEVSELTQSESFSSCCTQKRDKAIEVLDETNELLIGSLSETEENFPAKFKEPVTSEATNHSIELIEDTGNKKLDDKSENSSIIPSTQISEDETIELPDCNQTNEPSESSRSEHVDHENELVDSASLYICSEQEIETHEVEYDPNMPSMKENETVIDPCEDNSRTNEKNSLLVECPDISAVEDENQPNEVLEINEQTVDNQEKSITQNSASDVSTTEMSVATSSFDLENKQKLESVKIGKVESKLENCNNPAGGSQLEIEVPYSGTNAELLEKTILISPSTEQTEKEIFTHNNSVKESVINNETDEIKKEESKEQNESSNNKICVVDIREEDKNTCGINPMIENNDCTKNNAPPEKILYDDECSIPYVIDEGEVEFQREETNDSTEKSSSTKIAEDEVSVAEITLPNNVVECEIITLDMKHSSDQEVPMTDHQIPVESEEGRYNIEKFSPLTVETVFEKKQSESESHVGIIPPTWNVNSDDFSQQNVLDETSSCAINKLEGLDTTPKRPKSRCSDSHNVVGNLGKVMLLMSNTEPRRPKRNIPFTSPIKMGDACTKFDTSPTTPNKTVLDIGTRDSTYTSYAVDIENNSGLNMTPKSSAFNDGTFSQCDKNTLYSPTTFYSSYIPNDSRDTEVFYNIKECDSQKQQLDIDILASVASNQKPLKVDIQQKKSSVVSASKTRKSKKSLEINIPESSQTSHSQMKESTGNSPPTESTPSTPSKSKSKHPKSSSKSSKSEKRKYTDFNKTISGKKARGTNNKNVEQILPEKVNKEDLKMNKKTDKRKCRTASKDKKTAKVIKPPENVSSVNQTVSSDEELIIDNSDSEDGLPLNIRMKKCENLPAENIEITKSIKKDTIHKSSSKNKVSKGRRRRRDKKNNTKIKQVKNSQEKKLITQEKQLDKKTESIIDKSEKNELKVVTSPDPTKRIVHFKKAILESISQDLDENNAKNFIMHESIEIPKPIILGNDKNGQNEISNDEKNSSQLNKEFSFPSLPIESRKFIAIKEPQLQNSTPEITVEEKLVDDLDSSEPKISKPPKPSHIGESLLENNSSNMRNNQLNIYISPFSDNESELKMNNDETIAISIKELEKNIEIVSGSSLNSEAVQSEPITINVSIDKESLQTEDKLLVPNKDPKIHVDPVVRKHRKKELLETQRYIEEFENSQPEKHLKEIKSQDSTQQIHCTSQTSEPNQEKIDEIKTSLNLEEKTKLEEILKNKEQTTKSTQPLDIQTDELDQTEEKGNKHEKTKQVTELHKSSGLKVSLAIPDIDSVVKVKSKLTIVDNNTRRSLRSNSNTVDKSPTSKNRNNIKSSLRLHKRLQDEKLKVHGDILNNIVHTAEVGKEEKISALCSNETSISSTGNTEENFSTQPSPNTSEVKENKEQKHIREKSIPYPGKIEENNSSQPSNISEVKQNNEQKHMREKFIPSTGKIEENSSSQPSSNKSEIKRNKEQKHMREKSIPPTGKIEENISPQPSPIKSDVKENKEQKHIREKSISSTGKIEENISSQPSSKNPGVKRNKERKHMREKSIPSSGNIEENISPQPSPNKSEVKENKEQKHIRDKSIPSTGKIEENISSQPSSKNSGVKRNKERKHMREKSIPSTGKIEENISSQPYPNNSEVRESKEQEHILEKPISSTGKIEENISPQPSPNDSEVKENEEQEHILEKSISSTGKIEENILPQPSNKSEVKENKEQKHMREKSIPSTGKIEDNISSEPFNISEVKQNDEQKHMPQKSIPSTGKIEENSSSQLSSNKSEVKRNKERKHMREKSIPPTGKIEENISPQPSPNKSEVKEDKKQKHIREKSIPSTGKIEKNISSQHSSKNSGVKRNKERKHMREKSIPSTGKIEENISSQPSPNNSEVKENKEQEHILEKSISSTGKIEENISPQPSPNKSEVKENKEQKQMREISIPSTGKIEENISPQPSPNKSEVKENKEQKYIREKSISSTEKKIEENISSEPFNISEVKQNNEQKHMPEKSNPSTGKIEENSSSQFSSNKSEVKRNKERKHMREKSIPPTGKIEENISPQPSPIKSDVKENKEQKHIREKSISSTGKIEENISSQPSSNNPGVKRNKERKHMREKSIPSTGKIEENISPQPSSNNSELKQNKEQKLIREKDKNIATSCNIIEKENTRTKNRKTKNLYDVKQDSGLDHPTKLKNTSTRSKEKLMSLSVEQNIDIINEVPRSENKIDEIKCQQIQRKATEKNTPNPYILLEQLSFDQGHIKEKSKEKPRRSKRKRSESEKSENSNPIKKATECIPQEEFIQHKKSRSKEKNSNKSENVISNEYIELESNQRKTRSSKNKGFNDNKITATVVEKSVADSNINSVVSEKQPNKVSNLSAEITHEQEDEITENGGKKIKLFEDNQIEKKLTSDVVENETKKESDSSDFSENILNKSNLLYSEPLEPINEVHVSKDVTKDLDDANTVAIKEEKVIEDSLDIKVVSKEVEPLHNVPPEKIIEVDVLKDVTKDLDDLSTIAVTEEKGMENSRKIQVISKDNDLNLVHSEQNLERSFNEKEEEPLQDAPLEKISEVDVLNDVTEDLDDASTRAVTEEKGIEDSLEIQVMSKEKDSNLVYSEQNIERSFNEKEVGPLQDAPLEKISEVDVLKNVTEDLDDASTAAPTEEKGIEDSLEIQSMSKDDQSNLMYSERNMDRSSDEKEIEPLHDVPQEQINEVDVLKDVIEDLDDASNIVLTEEKDVEDSLKIQVISKGTELERQKEFSCEVASEVEVVCNEEIVEVSTENLVPEHEDKNVIDDEVNILPGPLDNDQNSCVPVKDVVIKSEGNDELIEKNSTVEQKSEELACSAISNSKCLEIEETSDMTVETNKVKCFEIASDSCIISKNTKNEHDNFENSRNEQTELITDIKEDTQPLECETNIGDDLAVGSMIETEFEVSEEEFPIPIIPYPTDNEEKSISNSKVELNKDEKLDIPEIKLQKPIDQTVDHNSEFLQSQAKEKLDVKDERKDLGFLENPRIDISLQVDESTNEQPIPEESSFDKEANSSDQEKMDEICQKELPKEPQLDVEKTLDLKSSKNKRKHSDEDKEIKEFIKPKKCKIKILHNEIIRPPQFGLLISGEKFDKIEQFPEEQTSDKGLYENQILNESHSTEGNKVVSSDKLEESCEQNPCEEVVEYHDNENLQPSVEYNIPTTECEVTVSEEIVIYSENPTSDIQLEVGVENDDISANPDKNEIIKASVAIEQGETSEESQCLETNDNYSSLNENNSDLSDIKETCNTSNDNTMCTEYHEERGEEQEDVLNLSVHKTVEVCNNERNISNGEQSSNISAPTVQPQNPSISELSFSIERMLQSTSKSQPKEESDIFQNVPVVETSKNDNFGKLESATHEETNKVSTSIGDTTHIFKHPGKLHGKGDQKRSRNTIFCGNEETKRAKEKKRTSSKIKSDEHCKVIVERVYSMDELAGGTPISPCVNYCSAPILPISTELIPYRYGVYGTVIPTAERIIMNNSNFNQEFPGTYINNSHPASEVRQRNTDSISETRNAYEENNDNSTSERRMECEDQKIPVASVSTPACNTFINETTNSDITENDIEIVQIEGQNDYECESESLDMTGLGTGKNDELKNTKCSDEMYDQEDTDIDESIMKEVRQIQNRSDSSTSSEIMRDDVELFDSIVREANVNKQRLLSSRNVDKHDFPIDDVCSVPIEMTTNEPNAKTQVTRESMDCSTSVESKKVEEEPQSNLTDLPLQVNSELEVQNTESSTSSNELEVNKNLDEPPCMKPLEDISQNEPPQKLELNIEASEQQYIQNINQAGNVPMKLTDIASATISAYGMKSLDITSADKFKISNNELNKCPNDSISQSSEIGSTKGSFPQGDVSALFSSNMGQPDLSDSFVNKVISHSSGSEGMESLLTSFQSAINESIAQNISSIQSSFSLFSGSDNNLQFPQPSQAQNEGILQVSFPEKPVLPISQSGTFMNNRLNLPQSTPLRPSENPQADDSIFMSDDIFDFDFNTVNQSTAGSSYSNSYVNSTMTTENLQMIFDNTSDFLHLLCNFNDVGCEVTVDNSNGEDIAAKPNEFIASELIQGQLIDAIPPYIAEEEFDSNAPTDPMVGGQKERGPDPKQDSNLDETPFPESALSFDEDMMHRYALFLHCDVSSTGQSCSTDGLDTIKIPEKQEQHHGEKIQILDNALMSQKNISNFVNPTPPEIEKTSVSIAPQDSGITSEISASVPVVDGGENLPKTNTSSPIQEKVESTDSYNQETSKKCNTSAKSLSPTTSTDSNKSSNRTPPKNPVKVQKIPARKYAPPKKMRSSDTSQTKKPQEKAEVKQSKNVVNEEKSENLTLNIESSHFLDMPQLLSPTESNASKRKPLPTSHKNEPKISKLEVPKAVKSPEKSPEDDVTQELQYMNMYDRAKSNKRNAARVLNYSEFYNDNSNSSNKNKKRKLTNKTETSSDKQEPNSQSSSPIIKKKSLERRDSFSELETQSKRPKTAESYVKEVRKIESHKLEPSNPVSSKSKNSYETRDMDSEFDKLKNSDPYKSSSSKNVRYTRTDRIMRSTQEVEGFQHQVPSTSFQHAYSDRGKREEHRRYPESYRKAEDLDYRRKHKTQERPRSSHPRSSSYASTSNDHRRESSRWSTQSEMKKSDAWHGRDSHKSQPFSEDRRRSEGHQKVDRWLKRDCPPEHRPSSSQSQQKSDSQKGDDWLKNIDERWPLESYVYKKTGH